LESARAQAIERSVQRRICQAALALGLLLGAAAGMGGGENLAAFSAGALRPAEAQPAAGGDVGWSVVDSFTDLRRRQAKLLRLESRDEVASRWRRILNKF
jgi:hypothetical protein